LDPINILVNNIQRGLSKFKKKDYPPGNMLSEERKILLLLHFKDKLLFGRNNSYLIILSVPKTN